MTEQALLSADTLILHRVASIDEADLQRSSRPLPVPLVPQHQPVVAQWYLNNGRLEMRWILTSQEG